MRQADRLAAGLDYVDLEFLGKSGIIATGVIEGRSGVALVDPGPTTMLETLRRTLEAKGITFGDVEAILLTHIHLDHAGSTGTLVEASPRARVFVHARGAPHLADPSGLLASAARLYGADMDRLWGEVRPVPAARLHVLGDSDVLDVAGHVVESVYTPGHASHHVSYFLPAARVAFVGDTAGMARGDRGLVIPPTPPPDIDLEAWRRSTDRVLAWHPERLFLTHFGPHDEPQKHIAELWLRLEDYSRRVRELLEGPGTDAEQATAFANEVAGEITRAANPAEAQAYADAGRFEFSWMGLARYWRKKAQASGQRGA